MNAKHTTMKRHKGNTDWNSVNAMTEGEINSAANTDPDALPLTKRQLQGFKRVHPPSDTDIKLIRQKLHLSQDEFAHYFGFNVRTLQEWEQHRRKPNTSISNFLKVIALEPEAVLRALKKPQDNHIK